MNRMEEAILVETVMKITEQHLSHRETGSAARMREQLIYGLQFGGINMSDWKVPEPVFDDIFEYVVKHCPSSISYIDVRYCRMTYLPVSIGHIESLTHIVAGYNAIAALPAFLCNLPKLRVLEVEHNRVGPVLAWPRSMPSLEELDVGFNPVEFLPTSFLEGLPALRRLVISSACLRGLPPSVSRRLSPARHSAGLTPVHCTVLTP